MEKIRYHIKQSDDHRQNQFNMCGKVLLKDVKVFALCLWTTWMVSHFVQGIDGRISLTIFIKCSSDYAHTFYDKANKFAYTIRRYDIMIGGIKFGRLSRV